MGGRRARSIAEIVGAGGRVTAQAGKLSRALAREDAEEVVASSAGMVVHSKRVDDILYYASKLIPFITRNVKGRESLSYEDREKLVREEWSRIKRKEGLRHDAIVTKAIISATVKAIRTKKKK
jgi:hypothetical protein